MSLILLHQPQFPHSLPASCMYTGKKKKKEIISAVIRYWFQWVQPLCSRFILYLLFHTAVNRSAGLWMESKRNATVRCGMISNKLCLLHLFSFTLWKLCENIFFSCQKLNVELLSDWQGKSLFVFILNFIFNINFRMC